MAKTDGKAAFNTDEEIIRVGSVLANRGVDVDAILRQCQEDELDTDAVLRTLASILYDGLAYGNWPRTLVDWETE